MRNSVVAVAFFAAFVLGGLFACPTANAQRLEPYQTYAETGLSLNYSGYLWAEEAYLVSLYNGFENKRASRALRDAYEAFYYGQNAYTFLHPNKYIQARDECYSAANRSYANFDYLYTYVVPFGTSSVVYDFTMASYYAVIYNYYAAVYYDAAFHQLIP